MSRRISASLRRLSAQSIGSGPIVLLISCGLALIAVIVIGSAFMAMTFRERALQTASNDLRNNARLLSRHFDQRFTDFSVLQEGVVERLRQRDMDAATFASLETHEWLKAKVTGTPDVAGINIFGSDGSLLNSAERWPVSQINIADRRYFKFLRDHSQISSQIELVNGRFALGNAIVFAKTIREPITNRFKGIVTRAVNPNALNEFFASVALGGSSAISLLHNDGALLARYPEANWAAGQSYNLAALHQTSAREIKIVSPIDGSERLVAVHSLANFPLSIVVSIELSSALADWRAQTKFLLAAAGLSAIIIAAVLALIIKQLLVQHRAARRHLNTALNNMTQGLVLYDPSERVVFCNDRYVAMSKLSRGSMGSGTELADVLAQCEKLGTIDADADAYRNALLDCVNTGRLHEASSKTADGRYLNAVSKPLPSGGWVTTLQDVTDRKQAEERILHLAQHDHLTGLANRELFRDVLEKSLAPTRGDQQIALIYIDISDFKNVNDTFGHPVGDSFLRSIAERVNSCIEKGDFVARLGGDEFAIIRRGPFSQADLTQFAGRLLDSLHRPHLCGDLSLVADASVGIAIGPAGGETSEELVKNADLAMYAAKAEGRSSFKFFSPDMGDSNRLRRELEVDLRSAISNNELKAQYQPIIDLESGRIAGCEALLRWRHPIRGAISPAEFIHIAEETGLIVPIGNWILKEACLEASSWPKDVSIAVNVSPVQLRCPTLALNLASALALSGLSPERLELEITEAVLIHDDEAALAVLHQIKSLGVRISLDDFGTGYSSLSYLRRFPFDKIKIDKSFIEDIADAEGSSVIVDAVVKMAHHYAMATVAEGVETSEQLSRVRELGCTQMQGYIFSRPLQANDVRALIFGAKSSGARAGTSRPGIDKPSVTDGTADYKQVC